MNNRKVILAESTPRCSGPSFIKDIQNGGKTRLFRVHKYIGRAVKYHLSAYTLQLHCFFCKNVDNLGKDSTELLPRRDLGSAEVSEEVSAPLAAVLCAGSTIQTQTTVFAVVLYP